MYWASSCHSEARSAEESPEGDQNLGKTLYHHPSILLDIDFYRAVVLKDFYRAVALKDFYRAVALKDFYRAVALKSHFASLRSGLQKLACFAGKPTLLTPLL